MQRSMRTTFQMYVQLISPIHQENNRPWQLHRNQDPNERIYLKNDIHDLCVSINQVRARDKHKSPKFD